MAFEIPIDLIKQVQISLRNEAKISSYDPDDPSLPDLPSVEQSSIADLDPSPPYLRCNHCRGRLLRGVHSLICVFCGKQLSQAQQIPPEPINFRSTFGCRWFLHSLHLDGSEIVRPFIEGNESNRGVHSATQEEVSLTEFLDLEIKWTAESKKSDARVLDETPVDKKRSLNYLFSEAKEESIGSNEFQGGHENLSLFENVKKPSETVESGDSFTGWEADFQSADSKTIREESKTGGGGGGGGPFVGSEVDLSAHMDSVFGSGKMKDDAISSVSNTDDWFQDDLWSNSTSGVTGQAKQFEMTANIKDGGTEENTNWIEDNQWQTSSNKAPNNKTIDEDNGSFDASWNDFTSSTSGQDPLSTNKAPDDKTVDEEDDSFEAWNDFTSSTSVQDPSNGSSGQAVIHTGSSNRAPDNKTVYEDNDSFDAWNDFASSTGAQDPSNSSSKQTVNHVTSTNEATDNKTIGEDDDSFDAWNDFTVSTGAQGPSNDSSKQSVSQLTSSNKAPDNKTIDQVNDSFDAWNDFTSSTSAQDPFNSSWKQSVNPSFEQNSETNLFSTANNLQNIDFGSILQPDFFSGAPINQNGSTEVKYMQSEASVSDRMGDKRDGGNAELVPKGEDVSNPTTGSKIDDVEMLLSQMHDLSFMLQSNLSIPSKLDGFSSFSKE